MIRPTFVIPPPPNSYGGHDRPVTPRPKPPTKCSYCGRTLEPQQTQCPSCGAVK